MLENDWGEGSLSAEQTSANDSEENDDNDMCKCKCKVFEFCNVGM